MKMILVHLAVTTHRLLRRSPRQRLRTLIRLAKMMMRRSTPSTPTRSRKRVKSQRDSKKIRR